MQNISESIETIGGIINELTIDENKIAEFREQYGKILTRSKDPNFYLSTIGDFSSGKSTLINTIIKRKLLKVAHAATTSVSTYIYRGTTNHVVVKVKCDDGKQYELTSESDASKFEKKYGVELPSLIDEKISLLTADKKLSLKIKKVDIELPNDELANGLCIIDTPGINPGADFAEKHADITKHILNEKADAIIILFPADQAYTQSFEKFLKDNAEYFMKDAIFVVTMMDRVDEDERDDVVKFVKANLRNNFKIDDPQVMSCSAMLSSKDPYWSQKFQEFEQNLMDRLAQNRQRIIIERLVKLSNELLNSIQSEIQIQKSEFEQRLSVVQAHSVPNLISVLADSKMEAISELSRIQTEHDSDVKNQGTYLESKIIQKVNAGLNACDTRSGITTYVNGSLTKDIEAACRDVYSSSDKHTTELNDTLNSAISGMIEKLKTYYGEIGSVLPENASVSAAGNLTTISDKLTGLSSMIGDYELKVDGAIALGGAGLAALVLTGLGPIGWIIGGVVALGAGDRLFVGSTRDKVRTSVSAKVPEISKSVIEGLCNSMQTNYNAARETLEAKKNELVSQYQPIYQELEKRFNMEKLQLTCKIRISDDTQKKVKSVLNQINQL